MARFGEYESQDEISMGPVTAVYVAGRAGMNEPAAFAVKVLDLSRLVTEVKDPTTFVSRFLGAADVQRRAAKTSAHWAPVHESGEFASGAYYVTDRYEHSLHRLIRGHIAVSSAKLHCLFSQIIQGLNELRTAEHRAHGNLKATNILLRSNRLDSSGNVLLADPLPESLGSESHGLADIECVGKLLYWLVVGREFTFRTPLPIEATPEWARLGRAGAKWRWLCDRMLDPHPPADLTPEWISQQLGRLQQRRPWAALTGVAAGAVLVGIGIPVALHSIRAHRISDATAKPVAHASDESTMIAGNSKVAPSLATDQVLQRLMDARNPAAQFTIHIEPEIRRGAAGDQFMTLTVTTEQDCHLLVLSRDCEGKISVLVPNALEAPIASAGKQLKIGFEDNTGVSFLLAPPWGPTTIKVIATRKRLAFIGDSSKVFTDLLALRSPGDWATAETVLVTKPPVSSSEKVAPAGDSRVGPN